MNRYRYSWSRPYRANAQLAGEIFQKFSTDDAVVESARDKKSPLHEDFDWDDSSAARAHRLQTARTMRCSLQVEVISKDKTVNHLRAFVRSADRTGYVPTMEASDDELTAAEQQCWKQMKTFRARWKGLQFAREIINAIADKERHLSRGVKRRHA